MILEIPVFQSDIDAGARWDMAKGPLALATARALGMRDVKLEKLSAGYVNLTIRVAGRTYDAQYGQTEPGKFARAFDHGRAGKLEPFVFRVDVPNGVFQTSGRSRLQGKEDKQHDKESD